MKRQRRTDLLLLSSALLVWFLADTVQVRQAASDALRLCAASVIPALFPFLVVSGLLISLGFGAWASPTLSPLMTRLFRLPGAAGSALLLGLLGGYPIGARTAADLYRIGQLTRDETERLLTFCNNANPAFFISVLGVGVFDSVRAGIWLLLIHTLSAVLTGLCFRGHVRKSAARDRKRAPDIRKASSVSAVPDRKRAPDIRKAAVPDRTRDKQDASTAPPTLSETPSAFFPAFVKTVSDAASAMLRVCAFVVFFAVLVSPLKRWNAPAAVPLTGALELFSLTPLLSPDAYGFCLASVCTGWGGLSVLGQTAAVLDGSGLSVRPCVLGKAVQACFSALLAALVLHIAPPIP